MNTFTQLLAGLLYTLGFVRPLTAANAESPGTHEGGLIGYLAEAAVAYHLVVKAGTAANEVDVCGVGDVPLGIAIDKAAADGPLTVRHLGAAGQTVLAIASASIARGALVVPAAGGKVRTLPTADGSYWIIGRAVQLAAADGDEVEIEPTFPTLRVVAS